MPIASHARARCTNAVETRLDSTRFTTDRPDPTDRAQSATPTTIMTTIATTTTTMGRMRFAPAGHPRRRSSARDARATAASGADDAKTSRATKASEALVEKFTTGGGGADGFCDYDDIKDALEACDGLAGAKLEACYAAYGCDVDAVTDHYAKAAGIEERKKDTE